MLYDPKWEHPLTSTRIIGWLESMPANKEYRFMNCEGSCLWDQYLRAVGLDRFEVTGAAWDRASDAFSALHQQPYLSIANSHPQTFGASLERARAALSSTMGTK